METNYLCQFLWHSVFWNKSDFKYYALNLTSIDIKQTACFIQKKFMAAQYIKHHEYMRFFKNYHILQVKIEVGEKSTKLLISETS